MLILAINVYNLTKGNLNDFIDNKYHNIEISLDMLVRK